MTRTCVCMVEPEDRTAGFEYERVYFYVETSPDRVEVLNGEDGMVFSVHEFNLHFEPQDFPEYTSRGVSAPLALASLEAVQQIRDRSTMMAFVWPNEGTLRKGKWRPLKDQKKVQPLWVDTTTAQMLLTVYDAVDEEKKGKIQRMIAKSRGAFFTVVEFGWKCVK